MITELGFEYLISNIYNHNSLEKIFLRKNFINKKFFKSLIKYSTKIKKLWYFNIKDNKINHNRLV